MFTRSHFKTCNLNTSGHVTVCAGSRDYVSTLFFLTPRVQNRDGLGTALSKLRGAQFRGSAIRAIKTALRHEAFICAQGEPADSLQDWRSHLWRCCEWGDI